MLVCKQYPNGFILLGDKSRVISQEQPSRDDDDDLRTEEGVKILAPISWEEDYDDDANIIVITFFFATAATTSTPDGSLSWGHKDGHK